MMFRTLFGCIAAALPAIVLAQNLTVGELGISAATARATRPGQTSGAAYVSIENKGKTADKLVAANAPIARSTQIHTMAMEGNVMKMREVNDISIAAGATVAMRPGQGYHIMLIGLKKPLIPGEQFPLALSFEKAGKVEIIVTVDGKQSDGAKMPETHQHKH